MGIRNGGGLLAGDVVRVALLIDLAAVDIGVEALPGWEALGLTQAPLHTRVYGSGHEHAGSHLVRAGIELVQAPHERAARVRLAVDAMEMAFAAADVSHFLLLSGSADLVPLVEALRAYGRKVTGMGRRHMTDPTFIESCDEFFLLEKVLGIPELSAAHESAKQLSARELIADPLVERYLKLLERHRVRMTPAPARPLVIRTAFNFFTAQATGSLKEQKQAFQQYFSLHFPHIDQQIVSDAVYQLFYTFCFEFERDRRRGAAVKALWELPARLKPGAGSPDEFIDHVDRNLLYFLAVELGGVEAIDEDIAARLLLGRDPTPDELARIRALKASLHEVFHDQWHERARRLVVRAYEQLDPEHRTCSALKSHVLLLDPTFDEKERHYMGFAQFLTMQADLIDLIQDAERSELRVVLRPDARVTVGE